MWLKHSLEYENKTIHLTYAGVSMTAQTHNFAPERTGGDEFVNASGALGKNIW